MVCVFTPHGTSPDVTAQVEQISRTARRQNLDLESLNEIRANLAQLPQKSVLFYPLVLKDSLELILVTPESPPIHRTVAVTREQLDQTIAQALQQAQIALITGNFSKLGQQQSRSKNTPLVSGDNLTHPYYWAPFILIGNGL